MKRLVLAALLLALPHTAFAATITWEAFGVINAPTQYGPYPPPPDRTPWYLEIHFDTDLIRPTPGTHWPPGSPCSMVPISGSFTLGGLFPQPRTTYTFGGSSGAFTNAMMPVDNCGAYGYGTVQFFMVPQAPDDPWHLWGLGGSYLLASYEDLFQNGTIPAVPTYSYAGYLLYRNDSFSFSSSFSPRAVQQPAPVPEPATTTLVGLGLALMSGRQWRRHRAANASKINK